ncbi:hypothetical protein [Corynebacterium variabile]|uniref:hypothetical protein n=1 Tax=Corynebacterium variabile TaxID=1727 RepID=UPI0028AF16BF|nr:hypothetical protein [Corynebacterium variabile]
MQQPPCHRGDHHAADDAAERDTAATGTSEDQQDDADDESARTDLTVRGVARVPLVLQQHLHRRQRDAGSAA